MDFDRGDARTRARALSHGLGQRSIRLGLRSWCVRACARTILPSLTRMFLVFLMLIEPTSSIAKPASANKWATGEVTDRRDPPCSVQGNLRMKKTRIAPMSSHMLSASLTLRPNGSGAIVGDGVAASSRTRADMLGGSGCGSAGSRLLSTTICWCAPPDWASSTSLPQQLHSSSNLTLSCLLSPLLNTRMLTIYVMCCLL